MPQRSAGIGSSDVLLYRDGEYEYRSSSGNGANNNGIGNKLRYSDADVTRAGNIAFVPVWMSAFRNFMATSFAIPWAYDVRWSVEQD